MGSDFGPKCQVEPRKAIWIVALVFASVVVVQYLYDDRVLSLFPMGESYFNTIGANLGTEHSSPSNNSLLGNLPDIEHTDEQDDSIVRTTNVSISNNASALVSESETHGDVGALVVANRNGPVAGNRNGTSRHESNGTVHSPVAANANGTSRNESNGKLTSPVAISNVSSSTKSPPPTEKPKSPPSLPSVASISDLNDMLASSRASLHSEAPLWSSAADEELLEARFQIEHAPIVTNHPTFYARIYRNLTTFIKSYEIMEEKLKVYVYEDGLKPVFHNPRLSGIYASEGWFMKHMESSSKFVTKNPQEAHLFYLPFSSQLLVDYVYVKDSHSFDKIIAFLKKYVETIKVRHKFWNRTDGADHFLVGCHDWATYETKHMMSKCIRAVCNSDIKEGFKFGKDVALPQTNIQKPENPMRVTGGRSPSERTTLAFFAGNLHGKVREILLKHWENKDPDMKIFGPIRKDYVRYMQSSKYCICAKGYEVNSPRVVEAILYGCVPVIVSDNFVPPFFDILNWETFAVFVLEKDIPNLKDVLVSISETRYVVMQRRVMQVRRHFLWHKTPKRYDIFHMILHSVWYNRVYRT